MTTTVSRRGSDRIHNLKDFGDDVKYIRIFIPFLDMSQGDATAAILLSYLFYKTDWEGCDGWISMTEAEMIKAIRTTRRHLARARGVLTAQGILQTRVVRGDNGNTTLDWYIDVGVIDRLLDVYKETPPTDMGANRNTRNVQTGIRGTCKPEYAERAFLSSNKITDQIPDKTHTETRDARAECVSALPLDLDEPDPFAAGSLFAEDYARPVGDDDEYDVSRYFGFSGFEGLLDATAQTPREPTAATPESKPQRSARVTPTEGPAAQQSAEKVLTQFDRVWAAYPRKVAIGAARKAWEKLRPSPQLAETIIDAVMAQTNLTWRNYVGSGDMRLIPHGATWLNAERWTDVVEKPRELKNGMLHDGTVEGQHAYYMDMMASMGISDQPIEGWAP